MTEDQFLVLVEQEVKSLSGKLDDVDFRNAIADACRETGWTLPESTDIKILWLKQRAKRHLFFYLATENAHKFKFEQVNLQHRFDHYTKMYQDLDKEYLEFMESRPDLFGGVDAFHLFGTKVDAGFAYNPQTGEDITYDADQEIVFGPTEND